MEKDESLSDPEIHLEISLRKENRLIDLGFYPLLYSALRPRFVALSRD
jgi:hypothetical protein